MFQIDVSLHFYPLLELVPITFRNSSISNQQLIHIDIHSFLELSPNGTIWIFQSTGYRSHHISVLKQAYELINAIE